MRFSRFFIPTLKEVPAEAEVVSHQLMLRAGMIRKVAAGVYSLLPLGVRVIRKIEAIIREEMNAAGAMEVFLPSIQPAELWRESGRWEIYGKELLRIKDRHDREFCYGPTHEEVITDLVRHEIRSYRDLPVNLYQVQTKFRDEIRPRFGVMRAREFSMKDAYSFDADDAGADRNYGLMKRAYENIFRRCGLEFRAVEADTGQIGGSSSHEFMVLAESGEDLIAYCAKCNYAANVDRTEIAPEADGGKADPAPMEEISTPDRRTIEEVAEFLGASPATFIKTLVYKTGLDDKPFVVAMCRGDHEINHVKLARAVGANEVTLAETADVERITGAPVGFAGGVGLSSAPLVADKAVETMRNAVTGANKKDAHLKNVNPDRDFENVQYSGIRQPVEGDGCPKCAGGKLKLARGIEVGHVFKLGVKYSKDMGATFLDSAGAEKPMIMGCYGIGVGRTAAASIEQNHDGAGVIWPSAIAPFDVAILPLNFDDEQVRRAAERFYAELQAAGREPILDDRDARPGVKFNDADLVGFPVQLIVGKKSLKEGQAEIKVRKTGERMNVPLEKATGKICELLDGGSI